MNHLSQHLYLLKALKVIKGEIKVRPPPNDNWHVWSSTKDHLQV